MFLGSFKGVSIEFLGCFVKVSWKRNFNEVSRVFHDFQGCFQSVLRKFQESFQGVLKKFHVA